MQSRFTFPTIVAILFASGSISSANAAPLSNNRLPPDSAITITNSNLLSSKVFLEPRNDVATSDGASFRLPDLRDSPFNGSQSEFEHRPRFDFGPRFNFDRGYNSRHDIDPMGRDHYGPLSMRSQEAVDRIGDMISPGFGRVEFDIGNNRARLDYLYSRRCRVKGPGICLRVSF